MMDAVNAKDLDKLFFDEMKGFGSKIADLNDEILN